MILAKRVVTAFEAKPQILDSVFFQKNGERSTGENAVENKSCIFKIHVIKYIGNKKGKGGESFAEYQIFYFEC